MTFVETRLDDKYSEYDITASQSNELPQRYQHNGVMIVSNVTPRSGDCSWIR